VRGHGSLAGVEPITVQLADPKIRAHIDATQLAVARGQMVIDEKDTHSTLMHGRIAAHLALWDDRRHINEEDWDLAGQVIATSATVRDSAMAHGKRQAAELHNQREQRTVHTTRTAAAATRADEDIERAADRIVTFVGTSGGKAPVGKASNAVRVGIRHHAPAGIRKAIADGRLVLIDEGKQLALADMTGDDDEA
jgi:hypothetical protein